MSKHSLIKIISSIAIILFFCACQPDKPDDEQDLTPVKTLDTLYIATSSNMQYVVQVLTQIFNLDYNVPIQVKVGSSADLAAQIAKDTLFDFLFTTDQAFLDSLFQNGFNPSPPLDIAYGKLVLWTMESGYMPDMVALRSSNIKKVALPDPKTTAYGATILSILEKEQMMDFLGPRLVYQKNLVETNQLITSGEVSIGFTAKSLVLSPQYTEVGSWIEVDDRLYDPIPHQFLRLQKPGEPHPLSTTFEQFIKSQRVKDVLANFGFLPNGLLGND